MFSFISLFFLFFFWSILSDKCTYEFYKTQPFISLPILAALNMDGLEPNSIFNRFNSNIESRSFQKNGLTLPSNNDFTKENANDSSDNLDTTIRFASLGLAVKNIFQDLIVRRFVSFTRLNRMASYIWES